MRQDSGTRHRVAYFAEDPRRMGALATTIAVVLVTAALSYSVGSVGILAVGVAAVFLYSALIVGNPSWTVHGLLLSLFAATPPGDPGGTRIAGIFVYWYEPFLAASLVYAAMLLRRSPEVVGRLRRSVVFWAAVLFASTVVFGAGLGLMRGHPLKDVQEDVRPVVNMVIVMFVCAVVLAVNDYRRYLKTILVILVYSAAYTLYGSVTGSAIGGRMETAELVGVSGDVLAGGSTATRFLTNATPLALAVLLGAAALILLGRVTGRQAAPMFLSAVVISVLGFSRNTLLALGGALVFALVIAAVDGQALRAIRRLVAFVVVAPAAVIALSVCGHVLGESNWVDVQIAGYQHRVFDGFSQSTENADNSTQFRMHENEYILNAGSAQPMFGGGFGFRYKPPAGSPGSWESNKAQLYAHNSYGWIYVKTGLVGLCAFMALIAASVLPALGRHRSSAPFVAGASTTLGLSIAMIVLPLPVNHGNSALLGLVLGACLGADVLDVKRAAKQAAPVR